MQLSLFLYLTSWKNSPGNLGKEYNNHNINNNTKTTTKNQNKTKSRKDSKNILHSATGIGENMIYISAETSVIVQGLDLQTLTLRSGSFGGTVRKTPLPMLHNAISPKDDFIF